MGRRKGGVKEVGMEREGAEVLCGKVMFFFRQEFPFVSLERWSPTCVGLLVCAV